MPYYMKIDKIEDKESGKGKRIANNLLNLKNLFEEGNGEPSSSKYTAPIPQKTLEDTLLLASWNIREFDSLSFGKRSDEAMLYIAEIISRFDLVAIQEVKRDIHILKRLQKFLGRHWNFVVTDETMGSGGNRERLAFYYDTRKIKFTGLSGEIQLPNEKRTFARSPFMAGFQAGWFKFALCTVHIYYGKSKANDDDRIKEIDMIANHLAERRDTYRKLLLKNKINRSEYENVILLGDFNIFKVEDKTYQSLLKAGFDMSKNLIGRKTNTGKSKKVFDQIAYISDSKNIRGTGLAGVFNFYDMVYRDEDQKTYEEEMVECLKGKSGKQYKDRDVKGRERYYKQYWRTHMMSDHLPIWVELKTNFSTEYLERRAF